MKQKMGVIVPFHKREQGIINKRAVAIALFAKKIMEKYSALGMYGFDEAAMVFLEKLVEGEKKGKDIRKQIEFTVKLMLLHQNRNRLSRDIISENTAFQRSITNHVMINLNRLLTVDKRVYRELSQLSHNNVKLKEAYDKIVRLENYEKKLVFQMNHQQTIRPNVLKNSFYKMFHRMLKQNQLKLSNQIFQETAERQQFKQNLNKLLELQTLRSDVQRHEFLHVMKYGTLEERREAMEVLKEAVIEVDTMFVHRKATQLREEVQLQVAKNQMQERELNHIKQELRKQQVIQMDERKVYEEMRIKLEKQEKEVRQLIKEKTILQQESSPQQISAMIQKKIHSELQIDRMRYGME